MYAIHVQCTYINIIYIYDIQPYLYYPRYLGLTVFHIMHSWFMRTLRTKKPKAHFYFSEIKCKVTIYTLVQWLNLVYCILKCKSEFP